MYKFVVLLCAAAVLGAPQEQRNAEEPKPDAPASLAVVGLDHTVIPIISQSEELEPNGTYKFSFETGNGIKREEISYDKILPAVQGRSAGDDSSNDTDGDIHVQQGSYSYTAPDGTIISLRYTADENGFQPIGDHLPTTPPIPEAIQKSLNGQSADQPSQESSPRSGKAFSATASSSSIATLKPEAPKAASSSEAELTPDASSTTEAPTTTASPTTAEVSATPEVPSSPKASPESSTGTEAGPDAPEAPPASVPESSAPTSEASTTVAPELSTKPSA